MNKENVIQAIRDKNTDSILLVFVDGIFSEAFSDRHLLPKEIMIERMDNENVAIRVTKNTHIKKILHFVFLKTISHQSSAFRNALLVEENSHLSWVEEYLSYGATDYSRQHHTEMQVKQNSHVCYHKIQNEDRSAHHGSNIVINQHSHSEVDCFSLTVGAKSSDENLNVKHDQVDSHCRLYGFYQLMQDNQQMLHRVAVDHFAQLGQSKMLYKGILDKKSRAQFKGKVYIDAAAQKINASQANHHLLLSNEAEAVSKPELEIYADDVKCAHGATVGQLDTEALFYLRARGIDEASSKRLLFEAFADEAIGLVKNQQLFQYVKSFIRSER